MIFLLLLNLGLLIYYKYTGFFTQNINQLFDFIFDGKILPDVKIILPLGISFITFHKISYIIDVYRKPQKGHGFIEYLNYIFFFPKLLSGPIQQWNDSKTDYLFTEKPSINQRLSGIFRFALGIFKKVWIANVLGVQNELLLSTGIENLSSLHLLLLIFSYSMQLLFDFSAYTDMACGIALMLGIKLPENFNSPYAATSIREFWQRWHISLTSWFRNYLFLPLAYRFSSKLNKDKYSGIKVDYLIYIYAVVITFLLTGLWHGAAWTFVLWGLYHAVLLSLDRLFLFKVFKKTGKLISLIITFILVMFGWVIFIAPDVKSFILYFNNLFQFTATELSIKPLFWITLISATVFAFIPVHKKTELFIRKWLNTDSTATIITLKTIISTLFLIFAMSGIAAGGFNPFIYFRF